MRYQHKSSAKHWQMAASSTLVNTRQLICTLRLQCVSQDRDGLKFTDLHITPNDLQQCLDYNITLH